MLLDLPPLDPKLPASIESRVLDLCQSLREREAGGPAPAPALGRELELLRGSGLLSLAVPAQFGGKGASWGTVLDIVRRVAKADVDAAERLACQALQLATIQWLGNSEQQGELLFATAHRDWLWGSAVTPSGHGVQAMIVGTGVEVNGIASGHAALAGADRLLVSAQMADGSGTVLLAVDAGRAGVIRSLERAGAGGGDALRLEFRRLQVDFDECLGGVRTRLPVAVTLRPLLEQLGQVHLYVGICQGAFADLVLATRRSRRASLNLRVADQELAPQLLQRYADLWADLKAASVLARSAARAFEDAWSEGAQLEASERGRLALEIAEARLLASRAGAQVVQGVFEAMNAPAMRAFAFDRWWRELRTHSLHDPIDFRRRELGRWILAGELPRASLFS